MATEKVFPCLAVGLNAKKMMFIDVLYLAASGALNGDFQLYLRQTAGAIVF